MAVYVIISIIVLAVSLGLTPLVRTIAIRFQIGEYPSTRKAYQGFIPRLGGLGIIAGVAAGMAVAGAYYPSVFGATPFNLPPLLGGLAVMIGLGLVRDLRGTGSLVVLAVQIVASLLVIASGLSIDSLSLPFLSPVSLGVFGIPLTLLWLVGFTNAVKLLDGLDGLANGVTAIASASFLLIGVMTADPWVIIPSFCLLFASLGFFRYNFHPASVLLGDTGTLFQGFMLACLSVEVLRYASPDGSRISVLVPLVALAFPIVDSTVAFLWRLQKGRHPLRPEREHIHLRIMDLGLTARQTLFSLYAVSLLNGFVANRLVVLDSLYAATLFAILALSMYFGIRRLGYIAEMIAQKTSPPIQPLRVAALIDKTFLVSGDLLAVIVSFLLTYWFRFHSGLLPAHGYVSLETYITAPGLLVLTAFWLATFILAGLYEVPWDLSRVDYTFLIVKAVVAGTIILSILTLDLEQPSLEGRMTMLVYGLAVLGCVTVVRMVIVSFERKYEMLGYRRRNTIVVGTSRIAENLIGEIERRPGLLYNLRGIVDSNGAKTHFLGYPVLGCHEDIPAVVKKYNVEEVLIATTYDSREEMLEIVARCNGMVPDVKVASESPEVLSGFKIEEIIGHPLIRLHQTNLNRWQRVLKRTVDIGVSLVALVPLLPFWMLVGIVIVLDSPGPVLFSQERVGKKGKTFRLYKFRSMVADAEKHTGPVWATTNDSRITRVGRIIRKLRIDEFPQFINVLKGEMSLVGPRPERPFFVEQLKKEVGFYTRRLLVRPGITGWAQVKHEYDASVDDVREKIKYDLYYLEHMSLTLDLKIILRTIIVTLSGKGAH